MLEVRENNAIDWPLLIAEQAKSGLSKAAFCRQKGVKTAHFYYQQMMQAKRKKNHPVPLQEKGSHSLLMPIEIKKIENPKPIEALPLRFLLKNGLECILPSAIDSKRLKEIIEVFITC